MINTILERPILVAIFGGIVTLALVWMWLQTSYKSLLYAGLLALVLTIAGTVSGTLVETESEQIAKWLDESAMQLGSNQFAEIQKKIHPGASPELRSLEARAGGIKFRSAAIKRIHEIAFSGGESNYKAVVKINVLVECEMFGQEQKIPRYVELTLYRVDGQWLVSDAKHEEPTYGFKKHDE